MKFTGLNEKNIKCAQLTAKHLDVKFQGEIEFCESDCFRVYKDDEKVVVEYTELCEVFRGISFVDRVVKEDCKIEQKCLIPFRATSLDLSRNAVMTVDAVKDWIVLSAAMGLNGLYLYMEDVYTIPEYPYFGHQRGRYTKEELREIEAFANSFGIEITPIIQTLGHLNALKGWDCFNSLWDIDDILMVDNEEVYEFIEAEIRAIRDSLPNAKIISAGMDEATMMGRGKYMDKYGQPDTVKLFLKHLNRVSEICNKYGFRTIADTDLLMSLRYGEYWSAENKITPDMIEEFPKDFIIAYWDYYHYPEDRAMTENMMQTHVDTGKDVLYIAGAWNWWGFTPKNFYSNYVTPTAIDVAIEKGIKYLKISIFGDDGAECPAHSVLPSIVRTAEQLYSNDGEIEKRFMELIGVDYNDFLKLDTVSILHTDADYTGICPSALEKSVFYNDIMIGLMNDDIKQYNLTEKYIKDVEILKNANLGEYDYLMETQRRLAEFLVFKAELPVNLKKAYKEGDKATLENICEEIIPCAIDALEAFNEAFHYQWHKTNKPFGYDVQELRIGGQLLRLKDSKKRIEKYLNGEIDKLEELEPEDLPYKTKNNLHKGTNGIWKSSLTRSVISQVKL